MPMASLLRPRHGTAATLAATNRFRGFAAVGGRPKSVLRTAQDFAPLAKTIEATGPSRNSADTLPDTPSPSATPQHVPLTGLELFLAENPGLKPFLLAGRARERAITESAIAWSQICDDVFRHLRDWVCDRRSDILRRLRRGVGRKSRAKEALASKRSVEDGSLIDDQSEWITRDKFVTFDSPEPFGREFMPFFFMIAERFHEQSLYEDCLEDLRMKGHGR